MSHENPEGLDSCSWREDLNNRRQTRIEQNHQIAMVLHKSKQVDGLCAAGITTVGGLALASVDEEKNLRAVSKAQRLSDARPVFWNLKSEAAMRFDVRIGDLPRAPYGTCAPPCSKV